MTTSEHLFPRLRRACRTSLALAVLLVAAAPAAEAAGYSVPWSRVAGGGATFSTGAGYRLGGTIGQSDAGVRAGGTYVLRDGFWGARPAHLSAVTPGETRTLTPWRLAAPAPNPFQAQTDLAFGLPGPAAVRLQVFDVLGQRVRELVHERFGAGDVHVRWDGTDDNGRRLRAGIYFVSLDAAGRHTVQRLVMLP